MNSKLLSILAPAMIICGCELAVPEGYPVKAEADGIIDAREESKLAERIWNGEALLALDDDTKEFINDIDIFFRNEFERQGLRYGSFADDLHLFIAKDFQELAEEYRKHCLHKMPENVSGFYSQANDTVYISKTTFRETLITFQHEIGHGMRYGSKEYASRAIEKYSMIKAYALNKKLGSAFIFFLRDAFDSGTYLIPDKYAYGSISFAVQANRHNGNLEEAVSHIMEAPYFFLEKDVTDEIAKRGGKQEAYDVNIREMVQKDGFRESFRSLNDEEFEHLRDYLLKAF